MPADGLLLQALNITGRKTLVSRPTSPNRFKDVPPLSLSSLNPLSRHSSNSPVSRPASPQCPGSMPRHPQNSPSRPTSPRLYELARPASPAASQSSSSVIKQCGPGRSSFIALLSSQPTTPVSMDMVMCQPPDLTGQIVRENIYYSALGGYGDIWMGTWNKGPERCTVAVKVLRPSNNTEEERQKLNRRLHREIYVWKRLDHENIVPLFGTTSDFAAYSSAGMVSPWMEGGNLSTYLQRMDADLTLSDRFQILCDIAAGLAYLHYKSVIHGDLTGGNVLINGSRRACLVDFGLSSIKAEFEGTSYWSSTVGGAIRWRALELLPTPKNGYNPILTTACDIYSFGSVMLETLSAKMPYYDIRSDLRVLYELFHGIRPRRPSSPMLTNGYWTFITQCWHETPGSRPRIETVTECLHYFRRALEGPYSVGR